MCHASNRGDKLHQYRTFGDQQVVKRKPITTQIKCERLSCWVNLKKQHKKRKTPHETPLQTAFLRCVYLDCEKKRFACLTSHP